MFQINEDLSIYVTRGDIALFSVTAEKDGESFLFQPDDVIRLNVYAKKNCDDVVIRKDFKADAETDRIDILLTKEDTKVGNIISKPTDYWYEVVLNPVTNPQTIIGYDDDGAKLFRLYPEGNDAEEIQKEDIPIVDGDFSETSERPLQNHVITRRLSELEKEIEKTAEKITSKDIVPITKAEYDKLYEKGTYQPDVVYLILGTAYNPDEDKTVLEIANEALAKSKEVLDVANEAFEKANNALIIANGFSMKAKEGGTYTGVGIISSSSPSLRNIEGKGGDFLIIKSDSSVPYFVTPWGTLMPSVNGGKWDENVHYGGNALWITNTSAAEHPLDKKGVVYTYYHL